MKALRCYSQPAVASAPNHLETGLSSLRILSPWNQRYAEGSPTRRVAVLIVLAVDGIRPAESARIVSCLGRWPWGRRSGANPRPTIIALSAVHPGVDV